MPKEKRQRIEQTDEICGYWEQKNISQKNIARLTELAQSQDPRIAELASIILEVAKVHPRRRKRISFLLRNHQALFAKLVLIGWLEPFSEGYGEEWDGEMPAVEDEALWLEDQECDAIEEERTGGGAASFGDWDIPFGPCHL